MERIFQFLAVSAFINAVIFSVIILVKKRASTASIFLCALLVGVSVQTFLNAYDNRDFFWQFPHLLKISWVNPTFFTACIFLFVKYITSPVDRFRYKDLLYFLPFLIYVCLLIPFFLKSADEKRLYIDDFDKASIDDFGILPQLNMLFVGAYISMAIVRIYHHRKNIENYYSTTDKMKLRWLSAMLYAILGTFAVAVVAFIARKWEIPILTHIYHYNYLLVVAIVYWIGIQFLIKPKIFEPLKGKNQAISPTESVISATIEDDATVEKSFTMDPNDAQILLKKLLHVMENEHAYRNSELDIYTLAEMLGEKKHRISYVINTLENKNFFDFVNTYRVEEVKALLLDKQKQQFTILALALEAGFNSKSTFNHIFKKQTGLSPSEFRKSHLQSLTA